jgi:TorA maturation chaperone TorD
MTQQILTERLGLYSLLRALYTYPLTESLLANVAGLTLPPHSPLRDDLAKMQSSLDVNALNLEMTRLLEGPGRTPAPPYASFYLHNKQLMGPAAITARNTYLTWQAWPESDERLPADHLALELGFMAYLADLAMSSESDRPKALAASHAFLTGQITPWLPRFAQAVLQATDVPFFVGLVGFTQTAIQSDLDWLTLLQCTHPQSALSVQTPN